MVLRYSLKPAALLFALLMLPAGAQADPFTEALASTYNTHPRLKSEREQVKAVDEQVSQAVSGWRPQLSATYEKGKQRTSFDGSPKTSNDQQTKQLSVEQPIYSGGSTVAGTKAAENTVKAARADLSQAEQEVLFAGAQAYMDVVRDQALLELSLLNVEVLRQQLKASKDRFDVGELTRTDVAQSEARLSQAISEASQAEGNLESSKAVFKRVVDFAPGDDLPLPEVEKLLPATLEESVKVAEDGNPQILAAQFRKEAADDTVDVRTASLLPELSLRGTMRRQDGVGSFGESTLDSDSVVLSLQLPLYQSGAEYSRVREAKKQAQQRHFDTIDIEQEIRQNVTRAWESYETTRATIEANESAVRAAEIALEGVKQEQQYGARTIIDVLDAEQELFSTRVALVRAKRDRYVAMFNVLGTIGRFTAKDLQLPVTLYDPRDNYNDVRNKLIGF